jgi:formate C-acetyltransferase
MLYLTLKLSRGVRKFGVPDLLRLASGKRLGPETGDPRNFKSFDELMDAYRKQVEYFVEKMVIAMDACDRAHAELKTTPFISFAIEDCIKSGKDVTWGGARYNFTGPQAVGVADVADSLAAVKKFVFDERIISMGELLDALHSDFDGKEHLRQMLLEKAPKYGNDDDYVDSIARESASVYFKAVERHKNFRGGIFQPGIYSMSAHLVFGVFVGATPDGRRKGDPLTEGVSPAHGRERRGPTAVMASVAKIDHRKCSNGNVLNMKFSPSALERDADIKNFVGLNRTYFELGGSEVQYNVISAGVLREAQRNPEKYRGLVVRVAGYSALFTELDIATQNDIIGRMEHGGIIKAAE